MTQLHTLVRIRSRPVAFLPAAPQMAIPVIGYRMIVGMKQKFIAETMGFLRQKTAYPINAPR